MIVSMQVIAEDCTLHAPVYQSYYVPSVYPAIFAALYFHVQCYVFCTTCCSHAILQLYLLSMM